jgi:hypothetical protein
VWLWRRTVGYPKRLLSYVPRTARIAAEISTLVGTPRERRPPMQINVAACRGGQP